MNFSCCYVLTDNHHLQYFNQMMISLSSLRHIGFTGSVYVVTDDETALLTNPRRNELADLSAEIVVVQINENYNTEKEKSRHLKTSLRKHIQGNVLYIDTDTVFVSCLPEWISDDDIAMAYNLNGLNDNRSYYLHKKMFDQCGLYYMEDNHIILNSGVIWMQDTDSVHKIFDKWHFLWKELVNHYGVPNDQVSLNYLWKHNEIVVNRLPDRFNVQINQCYFSPSTLAEAVLLHYFNDYKADSLFSLIDPFFQKLDYRDERIQYIIHEPLSALSDCRWMKKDGVNDEYLKTQSFHFGLYMFKKHRRLFSIFEAVCQLMLKIRTMSTRKVKNIIV